MSVSRKQKKSNERLMDDRHIGPKLDALYDQLKRKEMSTNYAIQGGTIRALSQDDFGEYVKREPQLQYLFGATNLTPVEGILTFVEEPHTPQNNITNIKPIILRSVGMAEKIKTLIGKPIHISEGFMAHSDIDQYGMEVFTTIGVVLGAYYTEDENNKTIRYIGGLHELDFPNEVETIKKGELGNSYEALAPVNAIRETKDSVILDDYVFTGVGILRKDMAAFPQTGVRLVAMKQKDETVDDKLGAEETLTAIAKKLGINISGKKLGGKDDMSKELEVLEAKITEFEGIVAAKDTEIGTLSQQASDSKTATETLQAKVVELQAAIDGKGNDGESEEVTTLKANLVTIKAELATEKESKVTAETELAEIKADNAATLKWDSVKEKYEESAKESVIAALKKSEKGIPLNAEDISALTSIKVKRLVKGQALPAGGEQSEESKAKMRKDYGIKGGKS